MLPFNLPDAMIHAYDDLFIGLSERFPSSMFPKKETSKNQERALELIRYAVVTRLHWSPETVRDYLTMREIRALKLTAALQHIRLPGGIDPHENLFYIAWLLWPETKNCSTKDIENNLYEAYLDKRISRLPPEFFLDADGLRRACNCLIYAINKHRPVVEGNEFYLYEYFASTLCIPFLRDIKLIKVVSYYHLSPLDFLHLALNESRNDLYYSYFCFLKQHEPYSRK